MKQASIINLKRPIIQTQKKHAQGFKGFKRSGANTKARKRNHTYPPTSSVTTFCLISDNPPPTISQ